MKEELYTIPVTDGFMADCECPLCAMYQTLELNAIDYTMGPSYMEDDVRAETDKTGFCNTHLSMLYKHQNRLGLALILSTHMDYTMKQIQKKCKTKPTAPSLFRKSTLSDVGTYINQQQDSCFICNRIDHTMERYISTIFYLYKREIDFRKTFEECKGFCMNHYGLLYETAPSYLKGTELDTFYNKLNDLYMENMKRVRDDLEWFKDKFDYRFADEPWKNSKDALPRTMTKTNSILS